MGELPLVSRPISFDTLNNVEIVARREAARSRVGNPLIPAMSDAALRRQWLTEQGIDRQVVAGWVDLVGYSLAPDEGADWARFLNEHMGTSKNSLISRHIVNVGRVCTL